MKNPFAVLAEGARRQLRRHRQPTWVSPMLAILTDERFSDARWLFERKLDGIRCLAFRRGARLRLVSRNRESQNDTYPELLDPLLREPANDFIVDGEVVAFDGKTTSFSRLQQRMGIKNPEAARRSDVAVYYYLFDLLNGSRKRGRRARSHGAARNLFAFPTRAKFALGLKPIIPVAAVFTAALFVDFVGSVANRLLQRIPLRRAVTSGGRLFSMGPAAALTWHRQSPLMLKTSILPSLYNVRNHYRGLY